MRFRKKTTEDRRRSNVASRWWQTSASRITEELEENLLKNDQSRDILSLTDELQKGALMIIMIVTGRQASDNMWFEKKEEKNNKEKA